MSTAITYLRVSTSHQAESGLGIEAQRATCREWAEDNGVEIVDEFTDEGVSGTVEPSKRDGLAVALNTIEHADVFLVAKRDRVARDMTHTGMVERMIQKADATLVSAQGEGTQTDDPFASFFQSRMADLFAEYEALQASVRTKAALAAKRAKGEKLGGEVPYGKDVDDNGKLSDSSPIAAKIIDLRDTDGLSYRQIADRLEADGFEPKGKQFYPNTVRRIYKRESTHCE
jgi:DNA invertase Pin-like site-specific DNA recombinase